jgi:uncharacterized membrane protein YkoI
MEKKLVVPNEVLLNFKSIFPEVPLSSVVWEWEVPNKIYEAEFEIEGVAHEVEFFITGDHLLTEKAISMEDVPANIIEAAKEAFPTATIGDAEEIEYNNGLVVYEFSLQDGDRHFEIHVREDGAIVAEGEDL